METPQNATAAKEFQVTGISRSGRVRKKSSKLLDFESPEEVEKKPKRTTKPAQRYIGRGRPPNAVRERRTLNEAAEDLDLAVDDNELFDDDEQFEETPLNNTFSSGATGETDDELDNLVADLVESVEAESMEHANNNESKVRQSLYMTEKANKRKMLKNGKVVTGKVERKDKGKSRYTAYSLWAREIRKNSKFSKNQDLDFSNAARRLGELWANVSNKEKSAWRRKAKIQATKAKAREKNMSGRGMAAAKSSNVATVLSTTNANASFLNRATTSRTKKLAAERQQATETTVNRSSDSNLSTNRRKRNNSSNISGSNNAATPQKTNNAINVALSSTPYAPTGMQITQLPNKNKSTSSAQLPNIEIIDAAAHLKLLGESLTIIGERLKEHDGQIALSGSLSVLLDSLLCSLGPLLCLTTHIPGLNKKKQLSSNLATTLDNIAYVMPGL